MGINFKLNIMINRLLIIAVSLLFLSVSCIKEEDAQEPIEINPSDLPNRALKPFENTEQFLDTISYFTVKVNYLPQVEIKSSKTKNAFLRYALSYSLTDMGNANKIEMGNTILNDSTIILKSKTPITPHNNYFLEVFAKWQKKIGENGIWVDCEIEYNETISQTIITSLNPDMLNPNLLPNHALKMFSSNELYINTVNPFFIKVNYLPQREINVTRIKTGFLRYNLTYALVGEEGEVKMDSEILNDSTIILNPEKPLEFDKIYTLNVFADWQKKIGTSGVWENCADEFKETISQKIVTNIALNELVINESDFIFQYPLDRQFNYLENEYTKGYFRLTNDKQKQLMLKNYKIKLLNVKTGIFNTIELSFNEQLNVFEYELQASFLDNNSVYKISLLTEIDETIYSYYFKTSKYNSFTEKWEMLSACFEGKWRDNVSNDGYPYSNIAPSLQKINVTINDETLDYYEINSNKYLSAKMPLVQFETQVPEEWKTTAEWQIYSWSSLSYIRQNSDCKKYGFPPLRAIYYLFPDLYAVKLSDASLTGNIEYPNKPSRGIFVWEVQNFMQYDAWSASTNANSVNIY